jgi:integrase
VKSFELRAQADVFRLPGPVAPLREVVYFDRGKFSERAPGLALRVREAGSRKWVFFYRWGKKQRSFTIGDASGADRAADGSGWTLQKARTEARELRLKVDKNINPGDERKVHRETQTKDNNLFSDIVRDYLVFKQPQMKQRSFEECKRHLEQHWKVLNKLPVATIDRFTVAGHLRNLVKDSGPVGADRARSSLSAMFAWAIGEGLTENNPVIGTNKASDRKPRERVLSDSELAAIWNAAPDNAYCRIVRLLMITGQRREEIGGLREAELVSLDQPDGARIALPGTRTKNSRPHDVPLSAMAVATLRAQPSLAGRTLIFGEGKGGFSGWSKSKAALDAISQVKDWTLHDLRRTAATRMADLNVQPHVIEAILNHVSGHKSGVAGIYNRSTYAMEKRAALCLWASHIKMIVAQDGSIGSRIKRG